MLLLSTDVIVVLSLLCIIIYIIYYYLYYVLLYEVRRNEIKNSLTRRNKSGEREGEGVVSFFHSRLKMFDVCNDVISKVKNYYYFVMSEKVFLLVA